MSKKMPSLDYSSIEQRIMAGLLERNVRPTSALLDIHTITTAIMLSIPYSNVTKPQRSNVGKSMNFAMLYTPGAMWEVPSEKALMSIWSDEEKAQLCHKLGVNQPEALYAALTNHFNTTYKGAK